MSYSTTSGAMPRALKKALARAHHWQVVSE
jgi:hypothetical protein